VPCTCAGPVRFGRWGPCARRIRPQRLGIAPPSASQSRSDSPCYLPPRHCRRQGQACPRTMLGQNSVRLCRSWVGGSMCTVHDSGCIRMPRFGVTVAGWCHICCSPNHGPLGLIVASVLWVDVRAAQMCPFAVCDAEGIGVLMCGRAHRWPRAH
jgi:hypothetical protein